MTGLDAAKVAALQAEWEKITESAPEQFSKNLDTFERVILGLKEIGLNTAYDSTYEILAPGLDREAFRQKRTEMHLLQALNTYHGARRISDDGFMGDSNRRQYHKLNQLLSFDLPAYETHVATSGLSNALSPILVQEINDLCALKNSGVLQAELKRLNIECAKDSFRNAYALAAVAGNYRDVKMALGYAQSSLKSVKAAGGTVVSCMIPLDYDFDGYWTKVRVSFDRAAIVGLHDKLLLKTCGIEFKEATAYQAQGHFVLDASGSGHGALTLPIQSIVEKLVANKYNMKVPSMFTAMGTTAKDFWAAYQQERQAVAANPEHAKRLGPEYKPGL